MAGSLSAVSVLLLPLPGARRPESQSALPADLPDAQARLVAEGLARRHTLDVEYQVAVLTAQVDWPAALLADLTNGAVDWGPSRLAAAAPSHPRPRSTPCRTPHLARPPPARPWSTCTGAARGRSCRR